mgnify:CR=1 FL=1|jgi:S-adenosylmethionine hydrolase
MRPVITLTTDFGLDDPFVGIMKGVILGICPNAELVDLTHSISPQNVFQAAYALQSSAVFFPKNTIHLAVVDPGVGGRRRGIAIKTENYIFVGPDNGIFSSFLENYQAIELTNKDYYLKTISNTFHGRDIFAPAAAWLAKGEPFEKLGQTLKKPIALYFPKTVFENNCLKGNLIYRDRFGNLTSNISATHLKTHFRENIDTINVHIANHPPISLASHYGLGEKDSLSALINSSNQIEIFLKNGNASEAFSIAVGSSIEITRD